MLRTFLRCHPQVLSLSRPRVSYFSVAVKATTNEYPQVKVRPDVVDPAVSYLTSNQIILKGVSSQSQYKPVLDFDQMKLPPSIKSILKNEGFQVPTPIQALAWPIVLAKRDVISVARTGSGKTLGFLLPAFLTILEMQKTVVVQARRSRHVPPRVLVVAPTRELAQQIAGESLKYRGAGINTITLFGGAARSQQAMELRAGADIVVATPGRCNDFAESGELDLSRIECIVLDEADRMLDMGFEPQIRGIISQLPKNKQTVMFTATWPKDVQSLAGEFLNNPVQINIGDQDSLNANKAITQHIMIMRGFEKEERLLDLLMSKVTAKLPGRASLRVGKTIIFVSRKMACDEVAFELKKAGFSCGTLHGDKSQAVRSEVMEKFRNGRYDVLVATDVAARGLDVKDIMNVINYDFPDGQNAVENYVHRIGRTARGNSSGNAYSFMTQKNLAYADIMSELVGVLRRCEQEVPAELESAANNAHGLQRPVSKKSNSGGGSNKYGNSGVSSRGGYGDGGEGGYGRGGGGEGGYGRGGGGGEGGYGRGGGGGGEGGYGRGGGEGGYGRGGGGGRGYGRGGEGGDRGNQRGSSTGSRNRFTDFNDDLD